MKDKLLYIVMKTVTDTHMPLCTQGYSYLLFCKTLSLSKANSPREGLPSPSIDFNPPYFMVSPD